MALIPRWRTASSAKKSSDVSQTPLWMPIRGPIPTLIDTRAARPRSSSTSIRFSWRKSTKHPARPKRLAMFIPALIQSPAKADAGVPIPHRASRISSSVSRSKSPAALSRRGGACGRASHLTERRARRAVCISSHMQMPERKIPTGDIC
jgi:hypothetical protein